MDPRLIRPFTPTQAQIAEAIAAGKSYAEIAVGMRKADGGSPRPRTIRAHVEKMAQNIIGLEDMAARWAVFIYQRSLAIPPTKR